MDDCVSGMVKGTISFSGVNCGDKRVPCHVSGVMDEDHAIQHLSFRFVGSFTGWKERSLARFPNVIRTCGITSCVQLFNSRVNGPISTEHLQKCDPKKEAKFNLKREQSRLVWKVHWVTVTQWVSPGEVNMSDSTRILLSERLLSSVTLQPTKDWLMLRLTFLVQVCTRLWLDLNTFLDAL